MVLSRFASYIMRLCNDDDGLGYIAMTTNSLYNYINKYLDQCKNEPKQFNLVVANLINSSQGFIDPNLSANLALFFEYKPILVQWTDEEQNVFDFSRKFVINHVFKSQVFLASIAKIDELYKLHKPIETYLQIYSRIDFRMASSVNWKGMVGEDNTAYIRKSTFTPSTKKGKEISEKGIQVLLIGLIMHLGIHFCRKEIN